MLLVLLHGETSIDIGSQALLGALLDLRDKQIVTLAVISLLLSLREKMVVLTDELSELLVHLSFSLVLNLSEGVRDDGDQKVKHDHNQEQGCESKHQVNHKVACFSKLL